MKLYLIRHGETIAPTLRPERPLSPRGKEQAEALANLLIEKESTILHIFHSGILRAQESADILTASFSHDFEYKMVDNLTPTSPIQYWADEILTYHDDVALVGHMPYMGSLLEDLTGHYASFPNCGCVCLEQSRDGLWTIDWKNW